MRLVIKNQINLFLIPKPFTTFAVIPRISNAGRTYFIERFVFILNLKSGQFQPVWIVSKMLTSVLYIHPPGWTIYTFGVGYCLLLEDGQSRASML